jgi:hypothetical protein
MGLKTFICEGQTANEILGPFRLSGDHIIAVTGVMGGATVEFYHKMGSESDPGTLVELTRDSSMSFTSVPAPFPYQCSVDLPLFVQITGAGGSTDLNITAFKINK